MRTLLIICAIMAILLMSAAAFAQTLVDVPMDQQINTGAGDATTATVPLSFEPAAPPTEAEGFARLSLADGYYFSYIGLNPAGVGTIDISQPGLAFDIDCRPFCLFPPRIRQRTTRSPCTPPPSSGSNRGSGSRR